MIQGVAKRFTTAVRKAEIDTYRIWKEKSCSDKEDTKGSGGIRKDS
ncbi:MAG: hypothetical protein ACLTDC_08475 [Lachnospiraceae bacterium]